MVSVELLLLGLSLALFNIFHGYFEANFLAISFDEEAVRWAAVLPVGVAVWTFKEGVGVIFPDEKTSKSLHEWPDYWKLKVHFDIGIFNNFFYLLPCFVVWFTGALDSVEGAWVFVTFFGALLVNAFSFYKAKIVIRSLLLRVNV
ncbi:hypothetical protein [Halopseudomonas sp.]|uniref:hypothetical protein n=1 Tax=Halopseudomonas sp. TaxID=2901191 RepID=UPI001A592F2C|nr:hypothetical protein [Pseudomonas sp.]